MSKNDDLIVSSIIHSIGLKNNMVDSVVREIVEAQFRLAYQEIRKIDLSSTQEETINELKTNFYFKYLGKLHVEADKVALRNNKQLNKKNEENRES